LCFILSGGICCSSETGAANLSAGLNIGAPPSASNLPEDTIVKKTAENASVRWHHRQSHTRLEGVALVIHGLNCRPDKMETVIEQLNASGIDCLNLSLRGHGNNFSPINNTDDDVARMAAFKSVSYPLWKTEAYLAYQLVKKKSQLHETPMFFVGFSMGGLLGVDLLASNQNVRFDKMVLFAPALKMRAHNSLLKILSPFPRLVVPSVAHSSYLTNDGTPVAAYNALFELHAHFEDHLDPKINIPTVVFIDAQDELISFSGLQKMIQTQNLDQWKIHPVTKDKTATEVRMHHLIIDAASVGNSMWQEIVDVSIAHLLGGQPAGTIDE
jgi:alpha-beta hydrolase superfamily lysophospholipase